MPKFPVKIVRNNKVVAQSNQIEPEDGKHDWTWNEELICSKQCIEEYVIKKSRTPASVVEENLCRHLPSIKPSSIHMKVQNIKVIFDELGLENTLNINGLAHYSPQNKQAVEYLLTQKGIKF